ncbi:MAG TPA: PAS domain-containing protein, partial [Candidatus Acidoferrum sp.]|nr:PAS domain-containing protein [Candidatus Acidoferrum sp.]
MDDLPTNRFLDSLTSLTGSSSSKEDIVRYFAELIKDSFGIENVAIKEISDEGRSAMNSHILSTRKYYVDNNLSEYSQFPELLWYNNNGYRSYAVIPIMVEGKVTSVLELASRSENRFTAELIGRISLGTALMGFAMAYKAEHSRSTKLADYFDAVFNSSSPQMLVSSGGVIIKANKAAIKTFRIQQGGSIKDALGIDYGWMIASASKGSESAVPIDVNGNTRTYSISTSKVSDTLIYISLQDISDVSTLRDAVHSISMSDDAFVVFTDPAMNILGATDNFERLLGYDKGIMTGKSITDIVGGKQKEGFEADVRTSNEKQQRTSSIDVATLSGYMLHMRFSAWRSITGYAIAFVKADA